MTDFREVFSHRRVVLPVIHVAGEQQAIRNIRIAREAGADGVFLINHSMASDRFLTIHHAVVRQLPDWWIGVNCLDLLPAEVLTRVGSEVSGVWVDNALIDETAESQPRAEQVCQMQANREWKGLYFGGVGFKYQRPVDDLARAAAVAARYMDVVTTSGPGTGEAASPDKIRVMKEAIGEHPLAIASGITPENIADYLESADCFLVATGISKSFEELDPDRTQLLISLVRQCET